MKGHRLAECNEDPDIYWVLQAVIVFYTALQQNLVSKNEIVENNDLMQIVADGIIAWTLITFKLLL